MGNDNAHEMKKCMDVIHALWFTELARLMLVISATDECLRMFERKPVKTLWSVNTVVGIANIAN